MTKGAAGLRLARDHDRAADEGKQLGKFGTDTIGAFAIRDALRDEPRLGQDANKPIPIRTTLGIAGRKDQTARVIGRLRETLYASALLVCHYLWSTNRVHQEYCGVRSRSPSSETGRLTRKAAQMSSVE